MQLSCVLEQMGSEDNSSSAEVPPNVVAGTSAMAMVGNELFNDVEMPMKPAPSGDYSSGDEDTSALHQEDDPWLTNLDTKQFCQENSSAGPFTLVCPWTAHPEGGFA